MKPLQNLLKTIPSENILTKHKFQKAIVILEKLLNRIDRQFTVGNIIVILRDRNENTAAILGRLNLFKAFVLAVTLTFTPSFR